MSTTRELCLIFALACSCAAALDSDRTIAQFAHTAWVAKDGAPIAIQALAQTPDGYLWLGSPNGVYRFDGLVFERYKPQSGGPFPNQAVASFLALSNGDLWIGFSSGAISLLRQGNVTNYTVRDGVPAAGIWGGLAQDRNGTIWAATDSGLVRLEGNRWKEVGKDWNFPGKSARTVFLDQQGSLWVATEDTLVFLPSGARQFQPTGIRVGQVAQIAQAANGKLWMAETTRSVRPIPQADDRLPSDETEVKVGSQGILFDNDGALWVTSMGDGLRRSRAPEMLKGRIKEFSTAVESFTAKDGLSSDVVFAILKDREGNVWLGTKDGLDRFRKTNLVPAALPFKLNQPVWVTGHAGDILVEDRGAVVQVHGGRADISYPFPSQALSAYRAASGAIWWFCLDAIYRYDTGRYTRIALPPSFPKPYVASRPKLAVDGSGTLWLSAEREGLFYRKSGAWHRLGGASEFATLSPTSAFTDWMGRAWFAYGSTIVLLENGNIQKVFPASESPVGSVLVINGRGRHVWVGGESGLALFDGNRFRRITPGDSERFRSITAVEETSDGSLWLAEDWDVIEIPATEVQKALDDPSYRVKRLVFDTFDGLRGILPTVIQGTDGRLWLPASDGIAWVDPANISTNTLPPQVSIRSVGANGRQFGSMTNLTLPPRTTDLQIGYTALSLAVPEKVRFRYRLEGVDKDWQDAGTRRDAFYTRLGPGQYHFRVIASNNDRVWNDDGAHLDFSIAPAWYQTIWFRGLCVLGFFALLWAGYQMRVRQLQQQEQKFRDAVETMPALAFVADPRGKHTFMNRGWLDYTGLSLEEASESGWEKTIHPEDLTRVAERWRESETTGQPLDYEARLRRGSDGAYRWFLIRAVPVRDKHGKIVKWCGAATDIEDRKRAEQEREKLRQLEADLAHINRVSTLGEMAASLAHEIKQPIAAAMTSANSCIAWLTQDPPNLDRARAAAAKVDKYGNRAAEIIDHIRSLYRKSPPQSELLDVNEIVHEIFTLLRGEAIRYSVAMRLELAEELPKIKADRVQLQQVFMNLMLNAIEAMGDEGGDLTVKSQRQEGQLLFSVSDTGVGLPTGNVDQIFSAFFTTKPQGSGMGLSISRSIVESHGGRLWVTANDERGATFHFTLPPAAKILQLPAKET